MAVSAYGICGVLSSLKDLSSKAAYGWDATFGLVGLVQALQACRGSLHAWMYSCYGRTASFCLAFCAEFLESIPGLGLSARNMAVSL